MASGVYTIKIQVQVDKKGFASAINVLVNETSVASLKEDQDTGGGVWYEFKDLKINQGDRLVIEGVNDGEEIVRFSRLQMIKK